MSGMCFCDLSARGRCERRCCRAGKEKDSCEADGDREAGIYCVKVFAGASYDGEIRGAEDFIVVDISVYEKAAGCHDISGVDRSAENVDGRSGEKEKTACQTTASTARRRLAG